MAYPSLNISGERAGEAASSNVAWTCAKIVPRRLDMSLIRRVNSAGLSGRDDHVVIAAQIHFKLYLKAVMLHRVSPMLLVTVVVAPR